jgi:hypothetical protein
MEGRVLPASTKQQKASREDATPTTQTAFADDALHHALKVAHGME